MMMSFVALMIHLSRHNFNWAPNVMAPGIDFWRQGKENCQKDSRKYQLNHRHNVAAALYLTIPWAVSFHPVSQNYSHITLQLVTSFICPSFISHEFRKIYKLGNCYLRDSILPQRGNTEEPQPTNLVCALLCALFCPTQTWTF